MANERLTEGLVRDHFKDDPVFSSIQWDEQKSSIKLIDELLSSASKNNADTQFFKKKKHGYPEFIISFPTNSNYLIVVECKALTTKHESIGRNNPKDYAVDGVLHYASFLSKEFNVVAIAVSGETKSELKVSNFYWKKNDDTYRDTKDVKLLSISDYLQLFEDQFFISNFYTRDISSKAKELNEEYQAYSIPTTVRCTFVSAVLMSLLDRSFFDKYKEKNSSKEIIELMLASIDAVLQSEENLVRNKNALIAEYSKLSNEPIFSQQKIKHKKKKEEELTVTVVKTFISYLERNVYPLVAHPNIGYDFLGRFYTEFIRYAGSQQKQGLVLTPQHITQLFCDLVHLTTNDVVYDPCCGTGGFLVASLERMFKLAGNDQTLRKNIREKQICGVELRPDMFTYACSNMKFRGDGKSNIYNGNCFTYEQLIKNNHKPTIAFLNPPYDHGLANQMEFVEHALNVVAPQRGTVVAIVQQSCAFKDDKKLNEVKQRILSKHRLKAVLSMPVDLFYPVGVVTCIMVFEANKPNKGYKTWLGYFRDDGFENKKNLGRVDYKNKYQAIHNKWMSIYDNLEEVEGLSVRHEMSSHIDGKKIIYDEWCAEAYMKTDYSNLSQKNFQETLNNYLSYLVREGNIYEA